MGITVALLLGIIVWQQIQLNVLHRQGRQPGRIITLSANMPVVDVIEGSNVFTIPKGSRIQETTPRGFTAPSERGGEEYA